MWVGCIIKLFNIMGKDKKTKKDKPRPEPVEEEVELDPEVLSQEHIIKPTTSGSLTHSSNWPFLLKNYESMNILTSHYTPIPAGSTPLKRPLK